MSDQVTISKPTLIWIAFWGAMAAITLFVGSYRMADLQNAYEKQQALIARYKDDIATIGPCHPKPR